MSSGNVHVERRASSSSNVGDVGNHHDELSGFAATDALAGVAAQAPTASAHVAAAVWRRASVMESRASGFDDSTLWATGPNS